jgi:hypothetical protein
VAGTISRRQTEGFISASETLICSAFSFLSDIGGLDWRSASTSTVGESDRHECSG